MDGTAYLVGFSGVTQADMAHVLRAEGMASVAVASGETVVPPGTDTLCVIGASSLDDYLTKRAAVLGPDAKTFTVACLPVRDFDLAVAVVRAGARDLLALPPDRMEIASMLAHFQRVRTSGEAELRSISRLDEMEREAISTALEACHGQVSLTARKLGIGRSTLYRKIDQYGLDVPGRH